ncbi:putative endo-polygalacturonase [Helianthus debilis subsp. tardiflorus]
MGKIVFVSVLVMLLLVNVIAHVEDILSDNFDHGFGEVENLEFEDEEIELFDMPSWSSQRGGKILVNVDSFGAAGDGVSDDTKAFENAWKQACSTAKSVLLVPPGRTYLVNATKFRGPCSGKLIIQIDGTIIAPDEPKNWDPKSPRNWLSFTNLTGTTIQGHGVIDGSGHKWWAASCKRNKTNVKSSYFLIISSTLINLLTQCLFFPLLFLLLVQPCVGAPSAFTIDQSSAIKVKGLTFQNSQQMNFVISHCQSVRIYSVLVSSPEDSPNTDGIHLTGSTNVVIQNSKIATGVLK